MTAVVGQIPVAASGSANVGLPFVGLADGVRHYLAGLPSRASLIWFGELALIVLLGVVASVSLRRSSVPQHEKWVWVAVVLLALSVAPGVWQGDVGFRSLDTAYLFSWIVLFGTRRRLWPLGALVALAWILVALQLTTAV